MKNFFQRATIFGLLIIFTLLAGRVSAADETAEVELSLQKALAMAIRNNIELRVRALDSSMARVDLEGSRGFYDPFLSVSANHSETFYTGETYGTTDTTTRIGLTKYLPSGGSLTAGTYTGYSKPLSDDPADNWTDWYTSVGVTLVQPLLKNYGKETTELNISLAENSHEESLERFREEVNKTVYSVLTTYHRLYVLQQEAKERQRALVSARQLLAGIMTKALEDSRKQTEIANTEYAISLRLKELVDAERRVSDKAAKLRYLIGSGEKIRLQLVDPPFRTEPLETEAEAIRLAMEQHPELRQLKLELAASELQERVARRKLLPSLSMTAGAGFRGIEDQFGDSVEQIRRGKGRWWTAGMQFSMPLGNTAAKSDYQRYQLRTKQLQSRITDLEWQLRDDIEADLRSLISARVQLQLSDKAHRLAEQRLQQYRKNHQARRSSLQDVLNAENDLIDASNNKVDALEDFANAVALLWKDAGVLLERLNIRIDTRKPEQLTAGVERVADSLSEPQPAENDNIDSGSPATRSPAAKNANQSSFADDAERRPVADKLSQLSTPVATQRPKPLPKKTSEPEKYILKIGEYTSPELAQVKRKLQQAGFTPQESAGGKLARQVFRLKVADVSSQQLARQQLDDISRDTPGGFFVKRTQGSYRVYAGSFFKRSRAVKELQRLTLSGLTLTLEATSVKLPSSRLTVVSFNNSDAAEAGALKLRKLGLPVVVQKKA